MQTSRLVTAMLCGLGLSLVSQVVSMPFSFVDAQDRETPAKKAAQPRGRPAAPEASSAASSLSEPGRRSRNTAVEQRRRAGQRAPRVAPSKGEPAASRDARSAGASAAATSATSAASKPVDGQIRQREGPALSVTALDKPLQIVPAVVAPAPKPVAVDDRDVTAGLKPVPERDRVKLPPPSSASDVSLRERVRRALMEDKVLTYSARSISIETRDGEVTLRGELNTQFEKARVARTAGRVAGARLVHDRLRLRNPSDGLAFPVQE